MAALASSPFRCGDAVVIQGLKNGDWYNGATGTILALDSDDGRITVSLCSGNPRMYRAKQLRVKRQNLRPVPTALSYTSDVFASIDGEKDLPTKQLRDRFQAAGRSFAKARPWDYRNSASLPVTMRLIRRRGGSDIDDERELIRSVVISTVGKSGNAFGAAIFSSYARFVDYKRNPGQSFDGSMPLYAMLNDPGDAEASGRAIGNNPNLITSLCSCNRKNRADPAELLLTLTMLERLPSFWEELTSQPPLEDYMALPLDYRPLITEIPLEGVGAIGALIEKFDPPPPMEAAGAQQEGGASEPPAKGGRMNKSSSSNKKKNKRRAAASKSDEAAGGSRWAVQFCYPAVESKTFDEKDLAANVVLCKGPRCTLRGVPGSLWPPDHLGLTTVGQHIDYHRQEIVRVCQQAAKGKRGGGEQDQTPANQDRSKSGSGSWRSELGGFGTDLDLSCVPVPRLLALAYACMEQSNAASWREALRMASAAFNVSVNEIKNNGSLHASDRAYDLGTAQRQFGGIGQAHADGTFAMVLELALMLGDDAYALDILNEYIGSSASMLGLRMGMPDVPAPKSGLRLPWNSEPIFWNAALVWFRAKGGKSKRAQGALALAVWRSPKVWLYLCGVEAVPVKTSPERDNDVKGRTSIVNRYNVTFMQNTAGSAAMYYDIFGDLWRAKPGAIEWAKEFGAQPYADVTAKDENSKIDAPSVEVDMTTGAFSFSYFDDIDDSARDSSADVPPSNPVAAEAAAASISSGLIQTPTAEKVCCSFCQRVASNLKACGCKIVRYCGRECQTADWASHKLLCTWKKTKSSKKKEPHSASS